MKKKFMGCILALLLFCTTAMMPAEQTVFAGTGSGDMTLYRYADLSEWPSAPEIAASSAYMIELNTGAVLYNKNGDQQSYPASTTKVMTALLALENLDLNEEITFSHDSVTDIESGGNHWEFQEGEVLSVDECLQFLLCESVNEAGYALAERMGGSLSGFADMMNARAAELGATGTHFTNPHGLNDENHYTTAKDMALILWACVRNQKFQSYASLPYVSLKGRKIQTGGFSTYYNHHHMLLEGDEFYDPDVVCGKTGYTSIAGNTLVTYARRGNMDLVCVIMRGGTGRFTDTKNLLDYAFDNFTVKRTDDVLASKKSETGLSIGLKESAETGDYLCLPNNADWSQVTSEFVPAGGEDGVIGTRTWTYGGQTIGVSRMTVTTDGTALLRSSGKSGESGGSTQSAEDVTQAAAAETQSSDTAAAQTETVAAAPSAPSQMTIFGFTTTELMFLGALVVLMLILVLLLIRVILDGIADRRSRRRRRRRRR